MDLWFGDSWPIGFELGEKTNSFDKTIFPNVTIGEDNPLKAFPHYVSSHRNKKYINFARRAASIEFSLNQLIKFCNTSYDPNIKYTAFLCTTAQIRGFGKSFTLNRDFHYSENNLKTPHDIFVYDSIICINSFYAICDMFKIDCVVIPIFCNLLIPSVFDDLILFKNSLLTKTTLVEETFNIKFIEDTYGKMESYSKAPNELYDWIKPNDLHPNIIGHRKLAYKLIELLENH